jgi:hypothetical protein
MLKKQIVTEEALRALGEERLAALLLELAERDQLVEKHLTLVLAAEAGPEEASRAVKKRLSALRRSTKFLEWNRTKPLARELDELRSVIAEEIAPKNPGLAVELLWSFLGVAGPTHERCDDSHGDVGMVFEEARGDLFRIAAEADLEPVPIADRVFEAVIDNGYGEYDGLIVGLAPALGEAGLARIEERLAELAAAPRPTANKGRDVIGYGPGGPITRADLAESERERIIRSVRLDLADARKDPAAFAGAFGGDLRASPGVALAIAERFLDAGKPGEALEALDALKDAEMLSNWAHEIGRLRIMALVRLGRAEDAQSERLALFRDHLDEGMLRAYLKGLPDFEDIEAEEEALAYAEEYHSVLQALMFLLSWPDLEAAAALVLSRGEELDGYDYVALPKAAEALDGPHPLAATLLRRKLVMFALEEGRTKRYRHAARHVLECESSASQIEDWKGHLSHDAWLAELKAQHGRKTGFWRHFGG